MTSLIQRLRERNHALANEAADRIEELENRVATLERRIAQARVAAGRGDGRRDLSDPEVGGYREGDPSTSVVAAYSLNISQLKYEIMCVLRDSPTPLNGQEISDIMGVPVVTVVPRFPSMRVAHLVKVDGLRLNSASGREQISYVLTDRGKQAVAQHPVKK